MGAGSAGTQPLPLRQRLRPRTDVGFRPLPAGRPGDVRFGRMPTDFYLYSDSRHIGYSYLTVRPSSDFRGLRFPLRRRRPATGASLRRQPAARQAVLGRLDEDLPLAERRWQLRGSRLSGGNLSLQHGPLDVRLGCCSSTTICRLPESATVCTSWPRSFPAPAKRHNVSMWPAPTAASTRSAWFMTTVRSSSRPCSARPALDCRFPGLAGRLPAGRLSPRRVHAYLGYSWIRSRSPK